ncbi:hypothetical protein, partial [Thalassospira sp. UBA848]|uniref:hypothetical protein n=1 Tax=Thalassospira sp. UBA848 TaxID=1947677 RepID=UPI0025F14797
APLPKLSNTFLQKNDRNVVTQNFCAKPYIGFTFMTCKGPKTRKSRPDRIALRDNADKMFAQVSAHHRITRAKSGK